MVETTPLGLCVYLALVGPSVRQPGVRDSEAVNIFYLVRQVR